MIMESNFNVDGIPKHGLILRQSEDTSNDVTITCGAPRLLCSCLRPPPSSPSPDPEKWDLQAVTGKGPRLGISSHGLLRSNLLGTPFQMEVMERLDSVKLVI